MSMYYQLCDENDRLRNGISELGHRVSKLESQKAKLVKQLQEIVGDYNATKGMEVNFHSVVSIYKAEQLLKELEAQDGKNPN